MKNLILIFNCGSSSIKFQLFAAESMQSIAQGLAERISTKKASLSIRIEDQKSQQNLPNANYQETMQTIINQLNAHFNLENQLIGIGHRVVHGGPFFKAPTVINDEVIEKITQCIPLAPLHNPVNLLGIKIAREHFSNINQVAIFDTSFHQSLPEHAYLYAIPYELYTEQYARRYGFHGVSHQYVCQRAAKQLDIDINHSNFISAHLGNGASITAVKNGESIDTSMGLTPLEGLVMGTRSGDIDPGMLHYLATVLKLDNNEITNVLNKQSGLLGLSGISQDMRELNQQAKQGHHRAQLAIEIFIYRLAKYIASYMVPLQSLDALIFTGGIGENSALIREKVLLQLGFLGFSIDPELNQKNGNEIGLITAGSSRALVIKTNEEGAMAKIVYGLSRAI